MTVSLLPLSPQRGLRVSRAEGQYVWDESGRRYLDFYMGYGAAFLGHRHPKIVAALKEQLERYMTITPAFDTDARERCLEGLGRILPSHLERVYFLNSGSEANELALKIARKVTGRKKMLAFINSFHGRTLASLGVTWNPKYRDGYEPFPYEVTFTPFNSAEAVEKTLSDEYAAAIVEPVQGEGGIIPSKPEFLKVLEERCRETGALLIVDEVQCGFGRTGRVWAHQKAGIEPDMLVAAKAIGGGFPVSLIAVTSQLGDALKEGDHGSTYGGNPLALAAVAAAVDVLTSEHVPDQAAEKGAALGEALRGFVEENSGLFRGLRIEGLMIGLEMRQPPGAFIRLLQAKGLLAFKAGLTVLRFLPPYLINGGDMRDAVRMLGEAAAEAKPIS
ncbi:MAG: aspartate aminotransferase family protein [Nitrososphaerota archaeon]